MADIHKIGLLVIRDGRVLLCRKKRGTSLLILPGGKPEPDEAALECLARELCEELGEVQLQTPEHLGTYTERAAGELSKTVEIDLYRGDLIGEPEPKSEIAELVWFGAGDDWGRLAPSLANRIFPDLAERGVLRFTDPAKP